MSFLGGLDLGNPAEQALRRDLEMRRNDERVARRFSGYHYRGGADLVLREGRFWPGRVLPEQHRHLCGPMSYCFANSLAACQADPSLTYCEGYCTSGFGTAIVHGWCIAPDGGVVDLTLPCFDGAERDRYLAARTGLPFLHPSKWAYYGVTFATSLVEQHDQFNDYGLPMLDRSYAELTLETSAQIDTSEVHDFPILKVPYDPNRQELKLP
jgi:hypothetical protein